MNSWPENFEREKELYKQARSFLVWKPVFCPTDMKWCIMYYKMFREMRASWLVRTSSLYFRKARALRHTSALLRYNARNLCHQNERAQTLEKCEKYSPSVRASPHVIGLENSRCALYQSGAKLKPIACWPLVFFHASGSLLWYFLRSNWPIWFRQRALARLTLPKRGDLNMKAIFAVINTTWTVVKTRPENNSGLYGIWTHDLYDTGAALYQLS